MPVERFRPIVHLSRGGQCTYPCIPGVILTRTPHNILSKPLAALPNNHSQKNGRLLEGNESCPNDYNKFSDRISAESGIEPVTSCSEVLYDPLKCPSSSSTL